MIFNQAKSFLRARFPSMVTNAEAVKARLTTLLAPAQRRILKTLIGSYYAGTHDIEILQVLAFLDHHDVQMIPYAFAGNYRADDVVVHEDDSSGYPWAEIDGHRVYFPKEMAPGAVRSAVNSALVEQDALSPHCYRAEHFTFRNEGAAVLIGASDGIYCLSIMDHFSSVYLFEADPKWLAPLTMTFAPWGDKVKIVQKFVSDQDTEQEITFAASIGDRITYLQADVEGAEKRLLTGARQMLARESGLKLSLCCYHRHNDRVDLGDIVTKHGFSVSFSRGYLIMWMQVPLRKPYLRRGVLHAEKSV